MGSKLEEFPENFPDVDAPFRLLVECLCVGLPPGHSERGEGGSEVLSRAAQACTTARGVAHRQVQMFSVL